MAFWRKSAKHEESPALDEALASIGAAQDVQSLTEAVERFNEVAENQPLPARELNFNRAAAYILAVDAAVRDDLVTEEEAGAIRKLSIGRIEPTAETKDGLQDAVNKFLVAIINTYGLSEAESDLLGLQEGELVVFEGSAAQLEREWSFRGQSYGISIPLAAGVRLHTNTFTGKQRTDPHWAVVDTGKLSATTERIIFRGESGTIEIALDTIVGLDLLPDALQIHAYAVEMFKCSDAPVLAASIAWLLNPPESETPELQGETQLSNNEAPQDAGADRGGAPDEDLPRLRRDYPGSRPGLPVLRLQI